MKTDRLILNQDRNVTLDCYLQEVEGEFGFTERPAILVLPGGGYAMCSDREADPAALAYARAGYQAFILRYTTNDKGGWPMPLRDYEQAMEVIASHAREWHISTEHIAVVGFSAGGHLAACAATIAVHKPAACILVYAAILKDIVDMCGKGLPYPNELVDANTCPCFLAACDDDRIVTVRNTLRMELALEEHGIPFESHIYSYGGHGFSTAADWVIANSCSPRVPHWVDDSIGWLSETMGSLTKKGISEPNIAVSKNGDTAPVLSVTCSLGLIRKQDNEVQDLLKPMYDRMRAVAEERGYTFDLLVAAVSGNTIRELMEMLGMDADTIHSIDVKLHKIVNGAVV